MPWFIGQVLIPNRATHPPVIDKTTEVREKYPDNLTIYHTNGPSNKCISDGYDLTASVTLLDTLNKFGGRVTRHERYGFDAATVSQHKIGSYNGGHRVVVSFHQHIGADSFD